MHKFRPCAPNQRLMLIAYTDPADADPADVYDADAVKCTSFSRVYLIKG